jgi:tripeptidyl-peptidase-1
MKSFALKTLLVAMAASSSSATRVAMERDMPVLSQTDSWSLVAETPAAEPVSALFMLKHVPAQLAELEETFWAVSDPKNARYGQHLTRDQTQLLLAPAAGNVARLTAWLKANGVAESDIKFPNADMVEVATSVGVASQLFGSTFQTWTHSSGTTLNRVEAYTLPSDIAQLVEIVGGIVRLPEVQGPIVVEEPSVAEWPDACGSSCPGRVAPGILEQVLPSTVHSSQQAKIPL